MSIILDALKKAEGGDKDKPTGGTAMPAKPLSAMASMQKKSGLSSSKTRVIAMGIVCVISLAVIVFNKMGGSGGSPSGGFFSGLFGGIMGKKDPAPVAVPVTPTPPPATAPVANPQPTAVTAPAPTVVPLATAPQAAPPTETASPTTSGGHVITKEEQELRDAALDNYRNANLDESAADYAKLIILNATDPELYNNYGVTLKKMGQVGKAIANYNKALALKPDYPEALNNLAVAYMADNKYDAARSLLEKALAIEHDYLDAHLHMAICLEKTGQLDDAISYYDAFLRMSEKKVDRKIRLQVEDRLARLKDR